MSNMPLISAAATTPPKAATPTAAGNEAASGSQPFGQVLASQMSGNQNKPAAEAKKGDAKTDAKSDADPASAASGNTASANDVQAPLAQDAQITSPDAMLGLLPAQQVLATQATEAVSKTLSSTGKIEGDLADKPAKRGKDVIELGKGNGRAARPELHADTQAEGIKKSDSAALTDAVLDAARSGAARQGGVANFQEALAQSQNTVQPSTANGMQAMQANNLNPNAEVRPAATTVNTPVAQPGWHDDFSQKVTWVATQNLQSADIHLNPPQLGPVSISLDIKGDQAIAHFVSAHPAVRDAIEQALPKLRQMMEDNGITLSDASVGSQARRDNPDTPQRKQQDSLPTVGSISDNIQSGAPKGMRITGQPRHNGMLDTFA